MPIRLIPPRVPFLQSKPDTISREWYRYYERIQEIIALLEALPDGKIWIGDTLNLPVPRTVSGDMLLSNTGVATLQQTANVDEIAQDAVGGILADTGTINLTYNDGAPSISGVTIQQMSITADGSGLKLVNDETSPGNSEYYGTNGAGTKGYYPLPEVSPEVIEAAGYWSPLTNGDVANPELIFAAGDTISVWTPTP